MSDYQQEREQARQQLNSLALGIASHLDGWEAQPIEEGNNRAHITHETGATFGLTVDAYGNRERVEVYGIYPNYPPRETGYGSRGYPLSGVDTPRITCALSRGPEAIARDIERRFLDSFIKCYELAVERIAADEEYLNDEEAAVSRLADILGVGLTRGEVRYNCNDIGATISPNGRDSVKFELWHVSTDIAAQICEILKGAR